jgi:hypothetical protein
MISRILFFVTGTVTVLLPLAPLLTACYLSTYCLVTAVTALGGIPPYEFFY